MTLDGKPDAAFWAGRGPLTIQMVMQPTRLTSGEGSLVSKWITTDGLRSFQLVLLGDGRLSWAVSASGNSRSRRTILESGDALQTGEIYALAAVFDPGKRMAIYINGNISSETTEHVPEAIWKSDVPVSLGARPGHAGDCVDAIVGDVWLLPRALDDEAVRQWAQQQQLAGPRIGTRAAWERAVLAPGQKLPPIRALTHGPKSHWFGYYDKFQTDPSDRYVLSMEADFDLRMPEVGDVARIGMIDMADGDKWIPLAETHAWNWQQGCMLQWRPGSDREILYNDREGDHFVCRVLDVKTGKTRTLPHAACQVQADGKYALCEDFARMRAMRAVIGYAVDDVEKYRREPAPADAGVWVIDLDTGRSKLVVSYADMAKIPYPGQKPEDRLYCNHTHWNPDGTRFLFINRGDTIDSRLMTAKADGSDLRTVTYGSSHFDWLDPTRILVEIPSRKGVFLFPDDGSLPGEQVLGTPPGHHSYLPGNQWLLIDTIPMGPRREQHVYLVHLPDMRFVPLGHFPQPSEYAGDVRCDNHPRHSRDGTKVIIDSAHHGGRQMYMIDISGIVGEDTAATAG